MNPFVNPNRRSILLPSGYKDLMDVLKCSESKPGSPIPADAIQHFIHLLLLQAQQEQATELVIGAVPSSGATPIRYKVGDTWHDLSPFPSYLQPDVTSELARMANLPVGQFPNVGILDVTLGKFRLRWAVRMTSADAEFVFVRIQD